MSRKYRPAPDLEPEPDPVRTTITLPEPIYLHLRNAAAANRCFSYELVTEALREWLPAHFATDGTPIDPN